MLISGLVLAVFLSLTGLFLERTYRANVVAGAQQQMQPLIFSLMGSAEEQDATLSFSNGSSQPRLQQPDSGLYALVTGSGTQELWRSPSLAMAGEAVARQMLRVAADTQSSPVGRFDFNASIGTRALYCLSNRVDWEGLSDPQVTFSICADQQPYVQSVEQFRFGLMAGFASLFVLLSFTMVWALRWGLRPLRRIQAQLNDLDIGNRTALDSVQPEELTPLVTSLNHYVVHQEALRTSHRQALDDLAHSLKTPLSVLGLGVKEPQPDLPLLQEQVVRMQGIVDHQLSRVARVTQSDGAATQRWVPVGQVVSQLVRALSVAYRDHHIDVVESDEWALRIHRDDLLDMLGNVLENACKYGAGQVQISMTTADTDNGHLHVVVEDDGPGIAEDLVADVVSRGIRLDSQAPGHGIGLSLVSELLAIYGGDLLIASSELGGAKVSLVFHQGRRLNPSVSLNAE